MLLLYDEINPFDVIIHNSYILFWLLKLVPFILVKKIYIIKLLLHATHEQTSVTSFNFVTDLRYAIIQKIVLRWIPYRIYQALVRVSCDTPEFWRLWRASNYSVYDPIYSWIVSLDLLYCAGEQQIFSIPTFSWLSSDSEGWISGDVCLRYWEY